MNRDKLEKLLKKEKIRSDFYAITSPYPNHQCLCLTNENKKWQVYFAERGKKWHLQEFNTEEDACVYFYQEAISSKTNRVS